MNTNEKHEAVAQMARRSLVLVGLLVAALCFAGPSRAQSGAGSAPSAAVKAADAAVSQATAGPAAPQTPASAPAAKSVAPAGKSPASQGQGPREGIKLHGHWIIEVKNPDGKVVTHREFENALQEYGLAYLSALLAGNNSPGGLSITLNGAHASYFVSSQKLLSFSDPGPCVTAAGPSGGSTCLLTSATSFLGFLCFELQQVSGSNSPTSPCSTNLTTSGLAFTSNGSAWLGPAPTPTSISSPLVILSGSVTTTSQNPGNINDVETVFVTCDGNTTPTTCVNFFNPTTHQGQNTNPVSGNIFTQKLLDGQNGDPAAVAYTPGQTIVVTVQFTFQ